MTQPITDADRALLLRLQEKISVVRFGTSGKFRVGATQDIADFRAQVTAELRALIVEQAEKAADALKEYWQQKADLQAKLDERDGLLRDARDWMDLNTAPPALLLRIDTHLGETP